MSKYINKVRNQRPAKKNNDSKISFVNLSTYTSPKIVESKSKEWVEFGADNNYFQYLIDRYNGSATNGAVINAISQMIYGKGLDATNSSRKPEQYARMISLFKKDDTRRFATDLKLTGQCAMQVIYSKDKKTIEKVEHLPIETLRAEKCSADDKEVQAYYYHPDWENAKPSDQPTRIPSFLVGESRSAIEILYVKEYKAGMYYYSTPDYQSGLQYSELEEEVSNYHLNNILNGLAPSMLINFNNGIPDDEKQTLIESKIRNKFSGSSNSGKFILAFNEDKESAADITPVQLSDAHNQYQFLSEESQKKIMISHRVVSPRLLGVNDSSGFGNNAEELKNASILMDNTVIRPFQELIIDSFDKILAYNNISLNLYFKTLQPLEFTDLDNVKDQETREEETGIKSRSSIKSSNKNSTVVSREKDASYNGSQISSAIDIIAKVKEGILTQEQAIVFLIQFLQLPEGVATGFFNKISTDLSSDDNSDFNDTEMLDALEGETIDFEEWELVDSREFDNENESVEDWASKTIKEKLSITQKLASFVKSKPNGFSYLDKSFYKVRYTYQEKYSSVDSRKFCKDMVSRNSKGVVYRLEDIDKASTSGVNKSFGHKGKSYDLFKYKGGVNCGHFFQEELYRMKSKTEKYISKGKEVNKIPNSYEPKPRGNKESKIAPKDMTDNGHHPNYKA